jgi:hypothetical protein
MSVAVCWTWAVAPAESHCICSSEATRWSPSTSLCRLIIVASTGYKGQLVVRNGLEEQRFSRAYFPYDRVVVLGAHGSRSDIRDRIAATQRAHWRARSEAEDAGGFGASPSAFNRLILPKLQGVAPAILATATGLSPGYCALIRAGKRIPHPRHWAALQLAGLQAADRAR